MFSIYRSEAATTPLRDMWECADSDLREAILRASRRLDQRLHTEPQEQGESRCEGCRILFEAPLGVLFAVDEDRKLVRILRTWTYRVAGESSELS